VLKNLKEERTRAFDYCMPYVFLPHKQSEADVRAPALAQPGAWRSGTRRVSGSGDPRASSARRPDLGLDLCPQVPDTCVDVMCEIPGRQAPLVFDFDWDMDEVAEVAEEKVWARAPLWPVGPSEQTAAAGGDALDGDGVGRGRALEKCAECCRRRRQRTTSSTRSSERCWRLRSRRPLQTRRRRERERRRPVESRCLC